MVWVARASAETNRVVVISLDRSLTATLTLRGRTKREATDERGPENRGAFGRYDIRRQNALYIAHSRK